MIQSKKGQFDEPAAWVGLLLGLIGAFIGLIIAKRTEAGILIRIMSAIVCGIACFFIGWKIVDSG